MGIDDTGAKPPDKSSDFGGSQNIVQCPNTTSPLQPEVMNTALLYRGQQHAAALTPELCHIALSVKRPAVRQYQHPETTVSQTSLPNHDFFCRQKYR